MHAPGVMALRDTLVINRASQPGGCWLRAATVLVADGCALLPLAASCCYYRQVVIPSGGAGRRRRRGIAVVPKEGSAPLPGGRRFLDSLPLARNDTRLYCRLSIAPRPSPVASHPQPACESS